ncbi:MAG: Uma2 family endonuclease [Cytophagaceae bacterium]|nr:Uma2 family endonuclease [Cytophagaceae bacterium]
MQTLSPPKLPLSWVEIPDELRVAATLEEYWNLVDEVDYQIEYADGEIFSFMGEASIPHEALVIALGVQFSAYFNAINDCIVLGSNVKIQPPDSNKSFNADVSVVRGKPEMREVVVGRQRRKGLSNLEIVVEIFSDSTRKFDQTTKLEAYKTIPSLRHVLFVEQHAVSARVVSRPQEPGEWVVRNLSSADDFVQLDDFQFKLGDVYRQVSF